jgi:sigma-E factor negative regulatory protein RseA
MQEKLSALVDGELDDHEIERVVRRVGEDDALAGTWQRYHLIRAALRNESIHFRPGLAHRISEAVEAEAPTAAAAPPARQITAPGWLGGMALAASLAVVAIGVMLAMRSAQDPVTGPLADVTRLAAAERATRWDGADPELEDTLNAFLVEHGEFTTASGMNGLISYAKFVSYDSNK